ncbi:hypothetical protein KCP70_06020 [Salmonella enterica subsp. enterica]|nr:hypothetical protein KCP70_06020 [Salmonella enterica subsp. enterica]
MPSLLQELISRRGETPAANLAGPFDPAVYPPRETILNVTRRTDAMRGLSRWRGNTIAINFTYPVYACLSAGAGNTTPFDHLATKQWFILGAQ